MDKMCRYCKKFTILKNYGVFGFCEKNQEMKFIQSSAVCDDYDEDVTRINE
jgi:hypothetical protein